MEHSFNKAIDLLYLAKLDGVEVIVNDERLQLKIAENKNIDENLLKEIRNNKQLLINYLTSDGWKAKNINNNHYKIDRFNRDAVLQIPLSFSQERLWFIDQLEGSVQYHSPTVLRLVGRLDKDALLYSLQTIIGRHEVLRTVFHEEDGQVYQSFKETGNWQLDFIEGSKYKEDAGALKLFIEQLIKAPFDLSNDYPVRASLIQLSDQENVLVVTIHHIASDAWSISIIVKEVVELYNSFVEGRKPLLPSLPLQYADFAVWQRNYLQGKIFDQKIDYWKTKLEGLAPLQLPTDFYKPSVRGSRGAAAAFNIDKELSGKLREFSQQHGASLFMVLLAGFKVLLQRYSGQQDISVGTSIASRHQKELEGLIGFFVNTLALRDYVNPTATFTELLQQVKSTTLEAYENQDVPFEKVVENVISERDQSHSPLFQVMLVLQNTPESSKLKLGVVELSGEPFTLNISKFDITFFINDSPEGLHGLIQYSTDLYNAATIQRMAAHFEVLLRSAVNDPDQKIALLPILTREAELQLIESFGDSKVVYPAGKSITALFEEQVAKIPGSPALIFENETLTYQQLNERANQLAHYLQNSGVKSGELVPLYVERSAAIVVGILGIMKAGAAYVPIDTDFPQERVSYMLKDTGATVIVSDSAGSGKLLQQTGVNLIEINNTLSESNENLPVKPSADQLAYVIYTSGSTGQPKGVMIEHGNLVDYYYGLNKKIQVDQSSSFALVSTIATDLGNTVIYASLLSGGALHLFSKESVSNIEYLHRYFLEHTIDCLKIVPSHWKALSAGDGLLLPKKLLIFGGEALQTELVEEIRLSGAHCRVINHYGPTETTIGKLLLEVNPDEKYIKTIPVGKVFSNTGVYILSKEMQLCPVGVPGQLYIAGEGLSRGYFNNPELTNQKFLPDPFSKQPGAKMYSTGDLVKCLPDGNIEFIGRIDNQVKIRGYRIEPGEIETVLQQSELVKQAVVLTTDDKQGNKRLVGYVVPEGIYNREAILAHLKNSLPDYMVPAVLMELESLPLTANGKVDRKKLPDPDGTEFAANQYVAPRNETEVKLAELWQNLLEVEQIGVNDDFFEQGGHSLLAVRLVSAIRKSFVVEMPIGDIFDYPTVALLAAQLANRANKTLLPEIKKTDPRPLRIPLSFSQERLWFIDQLAGSIQYHMPAVLRLTGNLNIDALSFALQKTVNRHEVLRTVYHVEEGQPYQSIKDTDEWQLLLVDGKAFINDEDGLQKYIQKINNSAYNLSEDYMLRATLISLKKDDHVLVVTIHHIASDGWSKSVLVNNFAEYYRAYEEGTPADLPALPVQYADYAIWQRKYLEGEVLETRLGYWREKLKGVPPLQLPADYQRPPIQSTRGAIAIFNIDKLLSARLQSLSLQQGSTLFMTLLATLKVLLYRYSGQKDICIGTPIAGRHQQEVEALIGFFVNTLALRTELNGGASFTDLLQLVKKGTLEAYEHQEAPFEKVVEAVIKERDLSRSPVFQVMFVLRNTPEVPNLELKGVSLARTFSRHTTAQFDMTFLITENDEGMQGVVEYSTDLFNAATIQRMTAHFTQLLLSVVETPQQKIGELTLLSVGEKQQLLAGFNNTQVINDQFKTIIDRFEEQVLKTPEAIALVFEEKQLTYRQLNQQSNQLAHYLQSEGIGTDTLVPVSIERSLEMIVGILGILKAGGTYVPIDPDYPESRIRYMLEDVGSTIVLGSAGTGSKLFMPGSRVIEINGADQAKITLQPVNNLPVQIEAEHLVYVIYTSGSTGKPKGVKMGEKGLVNLLTWQEKQFKNKKRRVLQFASLNFDVSFQEIFSTLCFGSCLYLINGDRRRDMAELFKNVNKYQLSHLFIPYIVLKNLAEHVHPLAPKAFPVEEIIVAGEQLKLTRDIQAMLKHTGVTLINQYGPTEAHVVTSYTINPNDILPALPPIGKPIDNMEIYILSDMKQPVPVGVPGELFIGGVQVAQGYLNLPQLTNEKFLPDPFSKEKGRKLYKTGDLSRWMPDGNIEYLGRKDDQVKIRGYRVELGEIEALLQKCSLVRQSVVLAKEDAMSNKRLVAYIVPEGKFDKSNIIAYLKMQLPEFMVPSFLIEMDNFPVTQNGKVDREALPQPDLEALFENEYVAPRNEMEKALADIWRDLLKIERVGIYSNFFELGGHSLLAIKLAHSIKKKINLDLSINKLFIYPTIAGLADVIYQESKENDDDPGKIKYLVPIKTGSPDKAALYIVCGGGGSALRFRKFAEMLDDDQPVYSLQSPIDDKYIIEFPGTIEKIAATFIEEISVKNPDGPYALSGHCLGGIIAFEMAKQLEAKGKKVNMLAMFDTIIRTKERRKRPSYKNLYNMHLKLKRFVTLTAIKIDFEMFLWRRHTKKAIQYKVESFNKSMKKLKIKPINPEQPGSVEMEIFNKSADIYKSAYLKYKIIPYNGEIILFYAKDRYYFTDSIKNIRFKKLHLNENIKNLWRHYANSISIFEVDGDHSNIFEKSHGFNFAKILQQQLNKTKQV